VKDWAKPPSDHVDPYHLGIRFVGSLTAVLAEIYLLKFALLLEAICSSYCWPLFWISCIGRGDRLRRFSLVYNRFSTTYSPATDLLVYFFLFGLHVKGKVIEEIRLDRSCSVRPEVGRLLCKI
jgi:hypothetical protein